MNISSQNTLSSETRYDLDKILAAKKIHIFFNVFLYISYLMTAILFLYNLKHIFLNNLKIISTNEIFYLCKVIILTCASISIVSQLIKSSNKRYKNKINKYIDNLPEKICTCSTPCNCRNILIKELQSL